MEKETELYLIERIRTLENENAYLKAKENGKPFNREDFKETCTKDDLSKALDNHFLANFQGYDVAQLISKAKAFDKIQELLNLAVANWVDEKRYVLYTTKPVFKKQIEIEIDETTFKQLWEVFKK